MQRHQPGGGTRATRWLKAFILVGFIGGLAAYFSLGGAQWLSMESLKAHRDELLVYTQHHYWLMAFATVALYTATTALSIPGATVLSLATGFLFGRWAGTLIIVVSATSGATLVFLAARYLFADAVQRRLGGRADRLLRGFHRNAFNYLLFVRLVPLFPFWLVNLAPALTTVRLRTYLGATALGIVPGSFVFAHLGVSLGRIESAHELLSLKVFSALALLGLFALIPVLVRRRKGRRIEALGRDS
ncbi:MAG TPA: TVP38/TMEM64 family protein [Gammaproteobacteria bacterium]|nr:TVP38/TMEM64 family protein [Gammaproteobacteria bacterium]